MDLFSIFTGDPAKQAAQQQRSYFDSIGTRGRSDIAGGYDTSVGAITGGTQGGLGALRQGYNDSANAVGAGFNEAGGALGMGRDAALGRFDQAGAAFAPLSELAKKYGGATTLGMDALGVNGADAMGAARGAFTAGPGYNFNLDQGIESISRLRNAQSGGNGVGGNADRDAQNYGAGLASQEYDKWLGNLLGFTNPELSATSGAATGQAAAQTNAGNLESQYGQNAANLATGRAGMLSDLATRYGTGVAGLETGQGRDLAGLATGQAQQRVNLGTALAQPYAKTYGEEAAAEMAGAGNAWKLGLEAAKLAAGVAGGAGFGGGGGAASTVSGLGAGTGGIPFKMFGP